MVFQLFGLGRGWRESEDSTIESRRVGATKAEQINGGYDFFRCPKDGIAPKALTLSGSPLNKPSLPEHAP
jgi:hypothetical protein